MSNQSQNAFQKLPSSAEALQRSSIRRMYAESRLGNVPNYICYLPEFALLMDSKESYQKAEELCFKFLSLRVSQLKNDQDLTKWTSTFPTLKAEFSANGSVVLLLDEKKIEHLTDRFQLNFEQRAKAYEFS